MPCGSIFRMIIAPPSPRLNRKMKLFPPALETPLETGCFSHKIIEKRDGKEYYTI